MHRKLLCDKVDQRLGLGVADDERDDALAQIVVWHADDGSLGNAGMPEQNRLDLACTDPVAARLDQVH